MDEIPSFRAKTNRSEIRGGTKLPSNAYLTYWHQALTKELGLYLRVTEHRLFVQQLYDARKHSGDAALEALMIFQPMAGTIFIAKKEVDISDLKDLE